MQRNLNENIKALRIKSGLSQVEFARHLSVTKQCVSNWENDNVLPSIEMLIKISDYFGVTTDYMLGRSSELYLHVDGLTEDQVLHLTQIINDIKNR